MAKIINPTKVVTGKNTRFSYLIVNEPKAINGGTPKYSVSLIIPKSDTVTVEKIKAAIMAAYEEGQGKLKGNGKSVPPLKALKTPLRDGDEERPDDGAWTLLRTARIFTVHRHQRCSAFRLSSMASTANCGRRERSRNLPAVTAAVWAQ